MGSNLCGLSDRDKESYRAMKRRRLVGNASVKTAKFAHERKDSCKVTLEDLIANSPTFNITNFSSVHGSPLYLDDGGGFKEKGVRVDIVSIKSHKARMETSSSFARKKLEKRVSFRSPQVADILMLSPLTYE